MAYSLENTTDLTALGNAIRTKTGESETMTVAEMATAVDSITAGSNKVMNFKFLTTTNDYSRLGSNSTYTVTVNGVYQNFVCIFFVSFNNSKSVFDTIIMAECKNGVLQDTRTSFGGNSGYPSPIEVNSVSYSATQTKIQMKNFSTSTYSLIFPGGGTKIPANQNVSGYTSISHTYGMLIVLEDGV